MSASHVGADIVTLHGNGRCIIGEGVGQCDISISRGAVSGDDVSPPRSGPADHSTFTGSYTMATVTYCETTADICSDVITLNFSSSAADGDTISKITRD